MSSKIFTLDLPHYILFRVLPLAKCVQLKYMHNLVNYTQVWANTTINHQGTSLYSAHVREYVHLWDRFLACY